MLEAFGRVWRRVAVLWRWRQHQADLREEMEMHREMKAREFELQGMSPTDAANAAARAMGNMTHERESARSVWVVRWADDLIRDASYAMRSMVRAPMFTAVAVFGLASGLGFSVAAYTAFNAIVLRGWSLPENAKLTSLYASPAGQSPDRRRSGFSYDELHAISDHSQTLRHVFAWERARADLTGSATAAFVTPGYFDALGVPIARGRDFSADEDRVGAPARVIVISDHWWRQQLQGRADVLGSAVRVSGVTFTVIGVTAPGFSGADRGIIDAWVPLTAMPVVRPKDRLSRTALAHSDQCCVQVGGRLADGATREDAAREITQILAQVRRADVDTLVREGRAQRFTLIGTSGPGAESELVPVFVLLFAGVGLVLVLACANVANLLLARAAVREREIGIRLALGASRGRLVRQLMTESLTLALLAVVPALVIARVLPDFIIASYGIDDVRFGFAVDWRVLAVAVGLAVMSCVLFGLLPALQTSRPKLLQQKAPLRAVFLSTQVAICLVLLVCTGLFFRSVGAGRSLDLGYEPVGLTEFTLVPPADEDETLHATRHIAELPAVMESFGVREWALSDFQPFAFVFSKVQLLGAEASINTLRVSGNYFGVARLRLIAGRTYSDGAIGQNEVVVNAYLANDIGGTTAALGQTLVVDSVPRTIVGVVANARDAGSVRDTLRTVYRPISGLTMPRVVVRLPAAAAQGVAQQIRDRDPSLGVAVQPYEWYVNRSFGAARGAATIAGALGALALLLAAVGMFGVFAYWVQQRRRDIGIRLALGASRGEILRLLLSATARAVGWGIIVGVGLAVLAAQALRSSLYGLPPLDVVSFGAAVAVLVASALAATLWPALMATRVSPLESIRSD